MTRIPAKLFFSVLIGFGVALSGCTGFRTFHDHVRAGDTIAVAAGWAHHLRRGNIEVKITDFAGTETTYTPGLPGYAAVKASVNLYPDPVSSLVVSERISKPLTPFTLDYSYLINDVVTNYDPDWWETVIYIDLPDPMALGDATIEIKDLSTPPNETVSSIVTIVPNEAGVGVGGTSNSFAFRGKNAGSIFNMADSHFQSLERVPHYEVSFSGTTVPYAIQVDLSHDPDEGHSGTGIPYVVNPIGHIKNLSWAATGTSGTGLRVIVTPAQDGSITNNMHDFKFYVAGGITGLTVNGSIQAFDVNGNSINGIIASIDSN